MKPALWITMTALALAACNTSVPDDTGQGVGFGDYDAYQEAQAARNAAEQGRVFAPEPETVVPPSNPGTEGDALASLALEAINAAEPTPSDPTPPRNTASISDEQNFDAVAARETIETDAERLARMAGERVEVAPTAVPERPGASGPNIVEYALSTTHPVGQQMHRRGSIGYGRHAENCQSFQSADLAQQAFLSGGGPDRDRLSLDPDGDGYACAWNPEIYRAAARGG